MLDNCNHYSNTITIDVGFPSACCEYVLLPLVNKEAVLANGLAEQSQVGNLNRDI